MIGFGAFFTPSFFGVGLLVGTRGIALMLPLCMFTIEWDFGE